MNYFTRKRMIAAMRFRRLRDSLKDSYGKEQPKAIEKLPETA